MKKLLFLPFLCGAAIAVTLDDIQLPTMPGIVIPNYNNVVESGTWFNFALQNDITPKAGTQEFTATLDEPIYNSNFENLMIPTYALASGVYKNTGESCSFTINQISFDNKTISINAINYSKTKAPLPKMLICNPSIAYKASQILDFTSVGDITLAPLSSTGEYSILPSAKNIFVQTWGTKSSKSSYEITNINSYANQLRKVTVYFDDAKYKDRLIPVYYDNYNIPHHVNYKVVDTEKPEFASYLFTTQYSNFGFAVLEK